VPESSEHPVYYTLNTRVYQSSREVLMLMGNLCLNRQNILYITSKHSRVSVWQRGTNFSEKSATSRVSD
jgi:hypothetical protein